MADSEIKVEKNAFLESSSTKEDSLEKLKRKDRKNILVIVIVIGVILAIASGTFSMIQFSKAPQKLSVDVLHELNRQGKLSPERGYMYGEHSIVKEEGLWWSDVFFGGTTYKIPLHFGPKEVESVPINGQLNDSFNSQPDIFLAIDPEISDKFYSLAVSELSLNLAQIMNRAPLGSCTKEDEICNDRKIISCQDTSGLPVIELALGDVPAVELSGSCIKITGNEYGITQAVDRLLYRWYGVMK